MTYRTLAIEKLDLAIRKNNEALGRVILLSTDLAELLLELGELIDGAIDDLYTEE